MKFKNGDKVRIAKKTDPNTTCWVKQMDVNIGKEGKIVNYNTDNNRIHYMVDTNGSSAGYWYPEESLEFASLGTTPYIRATKQEDDSSKFISNYPHKCPKCQAPAYISFLDKVDCSRDGCNGE